MFSPKPVPFGCLSDWRYVPAKAKLPRIYWGNGLAHGFTSPATVWCGSGERGVTCLWFGCSLWTYHIHPRKLLPVCSSQERVGGIEVPVAVRGEWSYLGSLRGAGPAESQARDQPFPLWKLLWPQKLLLVNLEFLQMEGSYKAANFLPHKDTENKITICYHQHFTKGRILNFMKNINAFPLIFTIWWKLCLGLVWTTDLHHWGCSFWGTCSKSVCSFSTLHLTGKSEGVVVENWCKHMHERERGLLPTWDFYIGPISKLPSLGLTSIPLLLPIF